jgi:hypothetical protein
MINIQYSITNGLAPLIWPEVRKTATSDRSKEAKYPRLLKWEFYEQIHYKD